MLRSLAVILTAFVREEALIFFTFEPAATIEELESLTVKSVGMYSVPTMLTFDNLVASSRTILPSPTVTMIFLPLLVVV